MGPAKKRPNQTSLSFVWSQKDDARPSGFIQRCTRRSYLNTIVCRPLTAPSLRCIPFEWEGRLKVTAVAGPSLISAAIDAQVSSAVTAALQSVRTSGADFVVNDSLWFAENDRGKVTPCVMNSATFISKKILGHLESLGWTKEKELIEQRIDAYVELPVVGQAYRVPAPGAYYRQSGGSQARRRRNRQRNRRQDQIGSKSGRGCPGNRGG